MSGDKQDRLPSSAELRDAVLGHSLRFERRVAFALLLQSDYPERETLLASIASNTREASEDRSAAAIALGHIPNAKAELLLRQILEEAPESVRADTLRSLGRIGSPAALKSIDIHLASRARAVAAAARFAGALIAHRFGLSGHDLTAPAPDELLPVADREWRSIGVARASVDEGQGVLASLGHKPYGIDLSEGALTQLRCGTDLHTLCLNRRCVASESMKILLQQKALLALVALESREGNGHSVSYVVLSIPSRSTDTVNLLAPRCTGRPALAGWARVSAGEIQFSLRAIDRPGARAVALDGNIAHGQVTVSRAIIATRRVPSPRPAYTSS